jgi:hypothetical protein
VARRYIPIEIKRQAIAMRKEGMTLAHIGKALGVHWVSVQAWVNGRSLGDATRIGSVAPRFDWDAWRKANWSPEIIRKVVAGEMF